MSTGKIILIEGHNYTGKTTLAERLVESIPDSIYAHSPQGLNKFTQDNYKALQEHRDLNDDARGLMMIANHIVIISELNKMKAAGYTIILDRSLLSTFVYQNYEMVDFQVLLGLVKMTDLDYDQAFVLKASLSVVRDRCFERSEQRVLDDHFIMNMESIVGKYHIFADVLYPDAHIVDSTYSPIDEVYEIVNEIITETE